MPSNLTMPTQEASTHLVHGTQSAQCKHQLISLVNLSSQLIMVTLGTGQVSKGLHPTPWALVPTQHPALPISPIAMHNAHRKQVSRGHATVKATA